MLPSVEPDRAVRREAWRQIIGAALAIGGSIASAALILAIIAR